MSDSPGPRLTREQARHLWERAMEIQLEAARRAEERALDLTAGSSRAERDLDGFTPDEVMQAAEEAGISREYLTLALAEFQGGSVAAAGGAPDLVDRGADRLLANPRRTLEVSRRMAAAPGRVLDVLREVVPVHPFFLALQDMQGSDPLKDGVLVFKVGSWTEYMSGQGHQTRFSLNALYAELDLLFITIRPAPDRGAGEATEVVVRAPLRKSVRSSWWWGMIVGTPLVAGGGVAGGMLGLLGLITGGPAALALGVTVLGGLAGAAAVGAGGVWSIRRLFDWGVAKGEEALNELLRTVDVTVRTDGSFRTSELGPGRAGPKPS